MRWLGAVRILLAAALTILILRYVDWPKLHAVLAGVRWQAIALALIAFAGVPLLEALRLKLVVSPAPLAFLHACRIHLIGSAFANVSPAQIGGDAYKVLRLSREGHETLPVSVRVVSLRVLGILIVGAAAAVSIALHPELLADLVLPRRQVAFGAIALAIVGVVVVAAAWRSRSALRQYLSRHRIRLGRIELGMLVCVSVLMLALRTVTTFYLSDALDLHIDAGAALLVTSLAMLATVLPISIAGLGVREGVVVGLLMSLSGSYEQAVGVALLGRALMILQGLLGVAWWLGETRLRRA